MFLSRAAVTCDHARTGIATERAGKPVPGTSPHRERSRSKIGRSGGSTHLRRRPHSETSSTVQAQKLWAQAGFGRSVAADFADLFPVPAGNCGPDRRPRWLGRRGSSAVRQGDRRHHQDLSAGHRMTESLVGEHTPQRLSSARALSTRGPRSGRYGSVIGFRYRAVARWPASSQHEGRGR